MEEVWWTGWDWLHEGAPEPVRVGDDPQGLVELIVDQIHVSLALGLSVLISASRFCASFVAGPGAAWLCEGFPDRISTEVNHSNHWPFEPPTGMKQMITLQSKKGKRFVEAFDSKFGFSCLPHLHSPHWPIFEYQSINTLMVDSWFLV